MVAIVGEIFKYHRTVEIIVEHYTLGDSHKSRNMMEENVVAVW